MENSKGFLNQLLYVENCSTTSCLILSGSDCCNMMNILIKMLTHRVCFYRPRSSLHPAK